ncbi:MAG: beta-lactamase family protein [Aquamicrobium sp.]|uniref:serine hydrolase domain-containing protein n=1 Tax=Aquamicrobium sp. TaxID=1872579 RepID=UPI00349EF6EF|nr:beta-lactamase family protein [Aquamicrobium sp.]
MAEPIPPRAAITLADWRVHPNSRYSFQHVSEFVPVAMVATPAGAEAPSPGPGLLARMTLGDPDGSPVDALDHMRRSHTDHVVVMRGGEVIAEWLAETVDPGRPHLVFSISKSITGLLAGIAAGEGLLDPDAPVTDYVPSMAGSTYASARVRDLLDMTVDLDFDEEYLDDGGAFDRYRRAMLWNPERPGTTPETLEAFLATLGDHGAGDGAGHGKRFYYASPNSDLLGLVVERAAGMRYPLYLAERLWKPMGARGAAWVTVDRAGTARAAGGVCLTTRDLARLGQLVLDDGRSASGAEVVPGAWIADMRANGDRRAWVEGNFADMFAEGRYRSCWYDVGDGRGSIAAVGIHGQWLWTDPVSRVVIAKTASRPDPSNDDATALEIRMLGQIARAFGGAP